MRLRGLDGMSATVRTQTARRFSTRRSSDTANLSNVLAATATALDLGVPLDDIRERATRLASGDASW